MKRSMRYGGGMTDLFALFPELPGPGRRRVADQQTRVRQEVERMRRKVRLNAIRQHAAADEQRGVADRVKATWAATRRRKK
jgi:hypothetical protein